MTPKRKATPLTVVPQIHCRRVRRRDPLANSKRSPTLCCPPYDCLRGFSYQSGELLH
ncbi:MAG: hypothetical protein LBK82_13645 [Planctomycetaceae bacterium]|nr:hypothetical protein [Planctomycetaceae bacterium]